LRANCDWLSFWFDAPDAPEVAGDFYIRQSVDTGVIEVKRGFHVFEGSFDTTLAVRSYCGRVYFSGNPSRFGRADNLFGYSLCDAYKRASAVLATVGITAPHWPHVTRVDLNTNFGFGSAVAAGHFMRSASQHKTSRQRQRAYDGDTVTYGEGSRYFYSKVYLKGIEMQRHAPGELADWVTAQGVVRYEAEYKSQFLRRCVSTSLIDLEAELMEDFKNRAAAHFSETGKVEQVDDLPSLVRTTYVAWKQGYDPRDLLARATFYRHRRALLDFGIDISIPASNAVQGSFPVPIVVVVPTPLEAPEGYELPPAHLIHLKRSA